MAKKALPTEAQMRVQQALHQTDWAALSPIDRLTRYRAAKEQITARVVADLATEQARRDAALAREAQAEVARWTNAEGAMAPSTLQQALHEQSIPPERLQVMERAIATVQAQGQAVTAEGIYRLVGGRRGTVQAFIRAWRAQSHEASPMAPSPVVPASPPPPPVSPLLVRREGCAQRRAAVDSRRRALAQDEEDLAHEVSALRNDLREAARLTRQVRQLQQQKAQPAFLMQADAVATYARVQQELTTLVGEVEVKRALGDPDYVPWWLEG